MSREKVAVKGEEVAREGGGGGRGGRRRKAAGYRGELCGY
jgi:hypothetical protein